MGEGEIGRQKTCRCLSPLLPFSLSPLLSELMEPVKSLKDAGAMVTILSLQTGRLEEEGEKGRMGEGEIGRQKTCRCLSPLLPFSLSPLLSDGPRHPSVSLNHVFAGPLDRFRSPTRAKPAAPGRGGHVYA